MACSVVGIAFVSTCETRVLTEVLQSEADVWFGRAMLVSDGPRVLVSKYSNIELVHIVSRGQGHFRISGGFFFFLYSWRWMSSSEAEDGRIFTVARLQLTFRYHHRK